jgi:hypothetical protein
MFENETPMNFPLFFVSIACAAIAISMIGCHSRAFWRGVGRSRDCVACGRSAYFTASAALSICGLGVGKVFGVLVVLSLAATGAAMARDISNGTVDVRGNTASLVKEDKGTAKSGQVPVSVRTHPIVMGRSVSAHHKTKLHHVKMKPLDSIDTPVSADGSY